MPSRSAQRRPGHAPRRHVHLVELGVRLEVRSTKAGARTPATPPGHQPASPPSPALNEGRGTHPGDTDRAMSAFARRASLNEGRGTHPGDTIVRSQGHQGGTHRSTKAGARTPATHAPGGQGRVYRASRSTKAGARTPATRWCRRNRCGPGGTLNEGRGTHPGDTGPPAVVGWGAGRRSTKAGARTPATPAAHAAGGHELRSAQRRPGHAPRRHWTSVLPSFGISPRSTKAGARTPATRLVDVGSPRNLAPLNEGRGTHPGDTPSPSCAAA